MSRSPAEPIQPARVPACSSKPGPPLITMALMRLREFLCLHSLASLSIIKKKSKKKKITSVSGKEWLRREKVSTSKCIDIENRGKLFCLQASASRRHPGRFQRRCVCQWMYVCQKPQAPVTEGLTYPCKQTTKVTSF